MPATGVVKQQLEAAARKYYETMNASYAQMIDSLAGPLSTADCPCRDALINIKQGADGGYKINSQYLVHSVQAHDAKGNTGQVTVSYDIRVNNVEDASGKIVRTFPPVIRGIKEVFFTRVGTAWLVSAIKTYR